MAKFEYMVVLPLMDNDGVDFDAATIENLISVAATWFGGATYDPQPARGLWVAPSTGKMYDEPVARLYVASEEPARVFDYARIVCAHLRQVCVYVRDPRGEVHFIEVEP